MNEWRQIWESVILHCSRFSSIWMMLHIFEYLEWYCRRRMHLDSVQICKRWEIWNIFALKPEERLAIIVSISFKMWRKIRWKVKKDVGWNMFLNHAKKLLHAALKPDELAQKNYSSSYDQYVNSICKVSKSWCQKM